MSVSVVIPHRNRTRHLKLCVESLLRSAEACGTELEIIVVDDDLFPIHHLPLGDSVKLLFDPARPPVELYDDEPIPFWKGKLLNTGIRAATGDYVVLLDADSLVSLQFFVSLKAFDDPTVQRVAYFVRYLGDEFLGILESGEGPAELAALFDKYETWQIGFWAVGEPDQRGCNGEPLFGNSQAAYRRQLLLDVPFDENYVGYGYEDLSQTRDVWRKLDAAYKCVKADRKLFHLQHAEVPGFEAVTYNPLLGHRAENRFQKANRERYYAT